MPYAIRIDGQGFRAVLSEEDIDPTIEYYAEELPPPDYVAQAKFTQHSNLRSACDEQITRASFTSNALGSLHNYDCRQVDQTNLIIRYLTSLESGVSEPVWASDGTRYEWKQHNASQLLQTIEDMNIHIKSAQVKLSQKLALVDASTSVEDVYSVSWES